MNTIYPTQSVQQKSTGKLLSTTFPPEINGIPHSSHLHLHLTKYFVHLVQNIFYICSNSQQSERKNQLIITIKFFVPSAKSRGLQEVLWLAGSWTRCRLIFTFALQYAPDIWSAVIGQFSSGHSQTIGRLQPNYGFLYKLRGQFEKFLSSLLDGILNALPTLWKTLSLERAIFPEIIPTNSSVCYERFRSWSCAVYSRGVLWNGSFHVFCVTRST